MEFCHVYIPSELILHMLKFCDIYTLNNFCHISRFCRILVRDNLNNICKFHKNSKLNNFFRYVLPNMNTHWSILQKFKFLLENYKYEVKRLKIIDTNLTPVSYCFSIASQGFYPFKNFSELTEMGFSEVVAVSVVRTISPDKLHLVKFLFNEGFNESNALHIVFNRDVESIYRIVDLNRRGFQKLISIRAIFNLNFDQIESMIHMKRANFPDEYCYCVSRDYDKFQINKILMLKNSGFNFTNSIRCGSELCEEKFSLLIKLKNKFPNHDNLTQLVFDTTVMNLEIILEND